MRFSVGYRFMPDGSWVDFIIEQKDSVKEVYFPFGFASGRDDDGVQSFEAEYRKRKELKNIKDAGISLNLLLNGNCYGENALSRAFYNKLGDTFLELTDLFGQMSVTTTSPLIAKFIKENFPGTEIRASVNMEIGTVQGIRYLSDYFDGFYLKREYNRNFAHIEKIKNYCDSAGKKLFLLANSGCLNNCSAHNFHDNLVAHGKEIAKMDNCYSFQGICWDYLRKKQNIDTYLCDSNFIRPEDVYLYEKWFDCVKLATRANSHPERILRSYIEGKYIGSVMNLLEPDHSGALFPLMIDNSLISPDFAKKVGNCEKNCEACTYCRKELRKSLIFMEE